MCVCGVCVCGGTEGGASKYRAAVASGGPASGQCNYFGISLQQLLAKEQGAAAGGIPILVRKCAEHIRAHGNVPVLPCVSCRVVPCVSCRAVRVVSCRVSCVLLTRRKRGAGMEAEGIFRVSGEQIDIVALKQEFESASDPNSITFADSTRVCGVCVCGACECADGCVCRACAVCAVCAHTQTSTCTR